MGRFARAGLAATLLASGAAAEPAHSAAAFPPLPDPAARLVLVGDAGDPDGAPLLRALGHFIAPLGERTTLVFLGDNFYPPRDAWRDAKRIDAVLGPQLAAGGAAAATWFVPGNHDWDDELLGDVDVQRVRALAQAVDADPRAEWAPEPGCPGPERIERGAFSLVAIDSEWWMLDAEDLAASAPAPGCPHVTREEAARALAAALACDAAPCAPRILIAHHPLDTRGEHGGHAEGAARLVRWLREVAPPRQDLASDAYQGYVAAVRRASAAHPPLLIAGGHDHSLQVFAGDAPPFQVVSGSGSKSTGVSDGLEYGSSSRGFMAVDFAAGGGVTLRVFEHGAAARCGAARLCETFRKALAPAP